MIINKKKYPEHFFSATALLLHVSIADDIIRDKEINLIKNIIEDFFKINKIDSTEILKISMKILEECTSIYELGKKLNINFNYQDKIDFISCAFEIAYADNKLHYLEEHFIKTIANILNVDHSDLIKSKTEIRNYLKI